ncbi:MAG: hypothetical protein L3J39_06420 [Verrucomicrobiales bacterium]|nr:hypothetical protein [Verrucomicrobiales bacterium]
MKYRSLLHSRATKTGLIVDHRKFLEGEVVPASRILKGFMTTTLPNVMTDIQEYCFQKRLDTEIEIGVPNSFVTANLVVAYRSQSFRVICGRSVVRSLWNPFAAEFGKNYDVMTFIESDMKKFHDELRSLLTTKYECRILELDTQEETEHRPLTNTAANKTLHTKH